MFDLLLARWKQGHRTMRYPAGPPPELPERFAGRPRIDAAKCRGNAGNAPRPAPPAPWASHPAGEGVQLDLGRCLFCRAVRDGLPVRRDRLLADYRLAASRREDLVVRDAAERAALGPGRCRPPALRPVAQTPPGQAGGCNACEADTNVLGTVAWDLGRFGIQFVASPRHADGLLITGPVPENMRLALREDLCRPSPGRSW